MYNGVQGYYPVINKAIEVNRYYVLSLKNLRKPVLLRFACGSRDNANRYIMLKTKPELHEVIKGYDALERGIKFSSKKLTPEQLPEKYCYPSGFTTWQKKKQHRTHYRDQIRKALAASNPLRQYTITYRGKTYTLFEHTMINVYERLHKLTGLTWKHFINHVSTKPTLITSDMYYIRVPRINIFKINNFMVTHFGKKARLKYEPSYGKVPHYEKSYLLAEKPKPKQLIF